MMPWIIMLCIVGMILAFAELLMPGFGIFGILSGICLLGTLLLIAKVYGILAFLVALVLVVLVFSLMLLIARKSGIYRKVVLEDKQEAKDFDERTLEGLLGAEGTTQTTLRPFGVADFDGRQIDVCSNGDFIDRGKKVRVTQINGKTVTVEEC